MHKLIAKITDKEAFGAQIDTYSITYNFREAARGIVLNSDGQIAIQHNANRGYYKLPGGGVDPGESYEDTLKREILEEVGCAIVIGSFLGMTIEVKADYPALKESEIQFSYCYICKQIGEIGETAYEQEELDDGAQIVWLELEAALEKVESGIKNGEGYTSAFITRRDKAILLAYQEQL